MVKKSILTFYFSFHSLHSCQVVYYSFILLGWILLLIYWTPRHWDYNFSIKACSVNQHFITPYNILDLYHFLSCYNITIRITYIEYNLFKDPPDPHWIFAALIRLDWHPESNIISWNKLSYVNIFVTRISIFYPDIQFSKALLYWYAFGPTTHMLFTRKVPGTRENYFTPHLIGIRIIIITNKYFHKFYSYIQLIYFHETKINCW